MSDDRAPGSLLLKHVGPLGGVEGDKLLALPEVLMSTRKAQLVVISGARGAALVSTDGSIDWWCPAPYEAPSVFARRCR